MIRAVLIYIFSSYFVSFAQETFQTTLSYNFGESTIEENSLGEIFITGEADLGDVKNRICKLRKDGTVIFDTIYSQTSSSEFYPQIQPTMDGGCILASESFSFSQPGYIKTVLIWKINAIGEIEWEKNFPANSFNDILTICDTTFLLVYMNYEEDYNCAVPIAHKIDLLGNTIWRSTMGDHQPSGIPPWLVPQTCPQFAVKVESSFYIYARYLVTSDNDAHLYKIDKDGNVNWQIKLFSPGPGIDRNIESIFNLNENYYFTSSDTTYQFDAETSDYWKVNDSSRTIHSGFGQNYQVDCTEMVVINKTGTTDYYLRKYMDLTTLTYETELSFVSGSWGHYKKSIDGGHLILTWSGSEIVITKTDCLGNNYWSTDCNSKIPVDQNILIYPNPSQNEIVIDATFDFDEVIIYSMNGEIIECLNPCKCQRMTLDISTLSGGIYTVRISDANQNAISRFVKI